MAGLPRHERTSSAAEATQPRPPACLMHVHEPSR